MAAAPAPPRRVLFVNHDADLRAVVTRVLGGAGFRVHAVAHSGHALLACRDISVDVVVTPLCGPDISGPRLVQQLARYCPGVRPIYLAEPGGGADVKNVLVHPFTRDDLVDRIERALTTEAVPA